jgi:3-(3-hydroxy-phenyl)propionate hydroxylase
MANYPDFVPYPFQAERHLARHPICTDGLEDQRHRVLIAGGGPVGFATALGLAKQGVASVVLEADDSVCFGSRAICVSRRSLEILHRLGVGAGFDSIGLPWTGGRSFYQGQEVLRFEMPQDDNQQFAPMVNMAQYSIEQTLLDGVQANANLIDVRWQTAVTGMSQDEAGVSLAVKTPTGAYQLHTDWLVAADGGRSAIRETMGLRLQGTSYEGRYVIVDILMKSPRPAERLAYFDPPCNPGSTVLVHKQPGDVWRIDYQLRDGEDPDQAILPEQVMPRVQSLLDMMGETAPWNPIWVGLYKANALTLERYRHGRVLFAGDAAHLVPIFGVRGFNSGIDDADNLSWKLGQVVSGCAAPALLDTYSSERVAATHENLSYGTKSTEFMAPPSFAFDLMRRAVLSLAVAHPELRSLINPRQSAPITYSASPLNGPDEWGALGPRPGTVLPECPLTQISASAHRAVFLSDQAGHGFKALVFTADGVLPPAWRRGDGESSVAVQAVALDAPHPDVDDVLWDHTGQLPQLLGARLGGVLLIRPDGHVMARWRDANDQGLTAVSTWLQQRLTADLSTSTGVTA